MFRRRLAFVVPWLAGLVAVAAMEPPPESPAEVPERAQREAQRLMNAGLPFVEKMLDEHGEFYPFAAVMLADGRIRLVGTFEGREEPFAEEVLAGLHRSLREAAAADGYRAIGVFVVVRVSDPGGERTIDAVQVGLEHHAGYCADVFFPVVGRGLGDAFAAGRDGAVFAICGGDGNVIRTP